jgi:DNA-binding NtrC family response regulator
VFRSEAINNVMAMIKKVAGTDMPVLLTGETGVGKEMLARRIHKLSGRRGRFVPVSCIAIPSSLMESELFGYAKGAFTGANEDKSGLFPAADNGTLFLDEIGEMPMEMQVKLLRVLEEGSVRPLGALEPVSADVRLIFATNRNLEDEVKRGAFREDLFYRISVIPINIPPLRERREDVPPLIEHFIINLGQPRELEKDALDSLKQYDWPGNVRELRNEMLRLTAISKGKIEKHMIKDDIINPSVPASTETLEEIERKVIHDVLQKTEFDTLETAKLLGIARSTLYEKMKRYGIKRTES